MYDDEDYGCTGVLILGFSRTGDSIIERYKKALIMLKTRGIVTEHDGIITLR